MTQQRFWGEGGRYGPYTAQEDGWPHAGEVMRDYRLRMAMSAEEAARLYSAALDKQRRLEKQGTQAKTVTASWILNMEKENRIPTDITRRRLLVDMLGIPYALFGLSPLEQVLFKPNQETPLHLSSSSSPHTKNIPEDVAQHEKNIRLFWQLHYTSTAYDLLGDIDAAILHLETLKKLSSGRFQEHIQALLNSYYQLGTEITRTQGMFVASHHYANKAVQVTKGIGQQHMLALAKYRRGYTSLAWGLFGQTNISGIFMVDTQKITDAIYDFESALPHALPQLQGFIKLELSRAYGNLKRSPTDITIALSFVDRASDAVGKGSLDDPYTPIKSLNEGMYRVGKAITMTAIGRPSKAIEELDHLDTLRDTNGIERNQLRRHAWINILYAQACIGIKEYYEATRRATDALLVCKDIHSVNNIAIINDIHSQLASSQYKSKREVKDLGLILSNYHQLQKEKKL